MQKFKTIFINSLPVIDEVICNESTAHHVPCGFFSFILLTMIFNYE